MSKKCGFCKKAVYPNDSHLNLDSEPYHTGCAKCADCKCQITLANFTKSGELLLCKTHYFERFNKSGSYAGAEKFKKASSHNSAPVVPVSIAPVTSSMPSRNEPLSEKAASVKDRLKMFGASVNEANKCAMCEKSVYPNDPQLALDGKKYHKGCAKCKECQCQITTSNFTRDGLILYCKTHYLKKFREEGKFVGEDKFTRKRGDTSADHLAGHSTMNSLPNPPSNEEETAARQKAEEEEAAARQKAEEEEAAARQKAEEEEAAARQKAEEEEAAARQKAEEEEAAARQKAEEEETAARQKAEEEETAANQELPEIEVEERTDEQTENVGSTEDVSPDKNDEDEDEDENGSV